MVEAGSCDSAQFQPFLELHYYKGGLRTEYAANVAERPDWAPPSDTVGFRDEIAIERDISVVEVAKFANSEGTALWIGAYRHSPDEVYGDRNNHAGIGIWLFNTAPSEPALLVEGLLGLLDVTKGRPDEFKSKGPAFLKKFVGGWLMPYTQLPDPLGGLTLASGPALDWAGVAVKGAPDGNNQELSSAILRLLFLPPEKPGVSRALVLVGEAIEPTSAKSKGFERTSSNFRIDEILGKLPEALESHHRNLRDQAEVVLRQTGELNGLRSSLDSLHRNLESKSHEFETLERDYRELQKALEENDELRRHHSLMERFTESEQRMFAIERELSNVRSQIVQEIRNELRSIRSSSDVRRGYNNSEYNHSQKDLYKSNWLERVNWVSVFWWFALIVLSIILIWALMMYVVPMVHGD